MWCHIVVSYLCVKTFLEWDFDEGKSITVRLAEEASVAKNCIDSVFDFAADRR